MTAIEQILFILTNELFKEYEQKRILKQDAPNPYSWEFLFLPVSNSIFRPKKTLYLELLKTKSPLAFSNLAWSNIENCDLALSFKLLT